MEGHELPGGAVADAPGGADRVTATDRARSTRAVRSAGVPRRREPQPRFEAAVHELEEVRLEPVQRHSSALWNEVIDRYHYLGYKPLPGAQLRYFAYAGDRLLGVSGIRGGGLEDGPARCLDRLEPGAAATQPGRCGQQRAIFDRTLGSRRLIGE